MTTDELKQEAEEYTNTHDTLVMGCEENLDCTKFMQRAYLAAAEPREKRIAELEATCNKWFEHLKNREEELLNELNNQNAKYNKQIAELETRCNELFLQTCEQAEKISELEQENADLKEEVNKVAFENGELKKENAELKKQLEMSNKVYNDNCDYSHHIEEQLTKAKEIIRQLLLLPYANNEEVYADVTSTLNKAEQFLSEVEK